MGLRERSDRKPMSDPLSDTELRFRVMTYNVHGFVGSDGRRDEERIARVIEELEPDLVALQEVTVEPDAGSGARGERLARRLNMSCHFSFTRANGAGDFGNAVLSRHACEVVAEGALPRLRGESRAVQWLRVMLRGASVHLMNTHLSIWYPERVLQVRALLGAEWMLRAGTELPLVVCGDFNSTRISGVHRRLQRGLRDVQSSARWLSASTWPAAFPFLPIDHLFVSPDLTVHSRSIPDDELVRAASDHRPLVAELGYRARLPDKSGAIRREP